MKVSPEHCRLPRCVCKCVCIKHPPEEPHTELPPAPAPAPAPVPPDLVVSVVRSSSGLFPGTLSAVSTLSGHIGPRLWGGGGSGARDHDPPPYEAPPSYKAATQNTDLPCQCVRSVTV